MKIFLNDKFILLLILFNGFVTFLNGYTFSEEIEKLLLWIDDGITIMFIIEMLYKIRVFGKEYFSSNWNRFDFTLVMLSIPALISVFFEIGVGDYSYLLVFRITRVFKAFRFLKFLTGIEGLLLGVQRAMKASLVVLTGFTIYIFIIGIFSFNLFHDYSP